MCLGKPWEPWEFYEPWKLLESWYPSLGNPGRPRSTGSSESPGNLRNLGIPMSSENLAAQGILGTLGALGLLGTGSSGSPMWGFISN